MILDSKTLMIFQKNSKRPLTPALVSENYVALFPNIRRKAKIYTHKNWIGGDPPPPPLEFFLLVIHPNSRLESSPN